MFSNGIVLEGELAEALLMQAADEGLCKLQLEQIPSIDWRKFEARNLQKATRLRDDALGLLLLYGKAIMIDPPNWWTGLERLADTGMFQFEHFSKGERFDLKTIEGCQGLHNEAKYHQDLLKRFFGPKKWTEMSSWLDNPSITYAILRYINGDIPAFGRVVHQLDEERRLRYELANWLGYPGNLDLNPSYAELLRKYLDDAKVRDNIHANILGAELYILLLLGLMEISSRCKAPLVASRLWRRKARTRVAKVARERIFEEPGLWHAYCIYLDEVEVVPCIRSLAHVERLQSDHHIKTWREVMYQWYLSLKTGDLGVESQLRSDIAKTNKELQALAEWKRIGTLLTYLSLPVAIASIFTDFPSGLIMAPVGIGIQVYTEIEERKRGWLLLGR